MTTHGNVLGKAVSSNDSGGFISVNSANSHVTVSMTNTVTVASGATLTALGTVRGQGDVTVASHSFLQPVTIASSGSGGLFAGGSGGTFASADFLTKTNMDGTIVAADNANVEAHTDISGAYVQVTADVGGLGVAGTTDADLFVGTIERAQPGRRPESRRHHRQSRPHRRGRRPPRPAFSPRRTHATAVGANSEAAGTITVGGSTQVKLENGATIVGNVDTSIVAEYADIDLHATADASCSCLGGATDSTATINANTDARVVGLRRLDDHDVGPDRRREPEGDCLRHELPELRRLPRLRQRRRLQRGPQTRPPHLLGVARRHARRAEPVARGRRERQHHEARQRHACTTTTATLYVDDPFTGTHTSGAAHAARRSGRRHRLRPRRARPLPRQRPHRRLGGEPQGEIWGDGGVFEFQQTWDYVKLLNALEPQPGHDIIDVVNTINSPRDRDPRRRSTTTAPDLYTSSSADAGQPGLDVRLRHQVHVPADARADHEHLRPSTAPARNPFIRLDDYIENPIGTTRSTTRAATSCPAREPGTSSSARTSST